MANGVKLPCGFFSETQGPQTGGMALPGPVISDHPGPSTSTGAPDQSPSTAGGEACRYMLRI